MKSGKKLVKVPEAIFFPEIFTFLVSHDRKTSGGQKAAPPSFSPFKDGKYVFRGIFREDFSKKGKKRSFDKVNASLSN